MQVKLSIGDFSRMTYLSVKALRHYHDVGVLAPAEVDPSTGYRYYAPNQVALAQLIRRLRDLGMPLDEVRTIVRAPDPSTRDQALAAHLERMEQQLEQTQQTVSSLRMLLQRPKQRIIVESRDVPVTPSLVIADRVSSDVAVAWWIEAFTILHRCLRETGVQRAGPDGVLFSGEFFEDTEGEVVAFLPVTSGVPAPVGVAAAPGVPASGGVPAGGDASAPMWLPDRVRHRDIPAARLAVTRHDGPFNDLDLTYGALGAHVLEQARGAQGPIREYYLPTGHPDDLTAHTTEVCWPVTA